MADKPDLYSIKELIKAVQSPAIRRMMKTVDSMRPQIQAVLTAVPAMQDAERAKRLSDLVRGQMKQPIGSAIKEIQAEIDQGSPLTGRQILFLVMEAGGLDVIEVFRQLAEIGKSVQDGGKKGHKAAYGSASDKSNDRNKWQAWINKAAEAHPDWSFEAIKKMVAKNASGAVSVHQLKRYTKDLRKKS